MKNIQSYEYQRALKLWIGLTIHCPAISLSSDVDIWKRHFTPQEVEMIEKLRSIIETFEPKARITRFQAIAELIQSVEENNTPFSTKLERFITKTTPLIRGLNSQNWDQKNGRYDPDKPCNLGAHLMNLFGGTSRNRNKNYMEGRRIAAELLDCCGWQFDVMLNAAGAPKNPFGMYPWFNAITKVWENLSQITEIPPDDSFECVQWVKDYHQKFNICKT